MNDELTYKLFKAIEANPATNQRELAASLELSLGKLNYCLKALLAKGLVKAENFIASNNKRGYLYKLTPAGLSEKTAVTMRFLNHKMREYEKIKQEIFNLRNEVNCFDDLQKQSYE
ncbi:MAG: Transcriptional regulator, MarR family [Candidatus Rifleibacterium amylolyticum]|nr:MAG: Transcriptional regulator, MarR family [Candidatus Rifleibacterium amylolyticum]